MTSSEEGNTRIYQQTLELRKYIDDINVTTFSPQGLQQKNLTHQQFERLGKMGRKVEMSGAILAYDRGLGKTREIIAWILRNENFAQEARKPEFDSGTLIVCSKTCLEFWSNEFADVPNRLSVHVHYGTNRNHTDLFNKDVVITTYNTLTYDRNNSDYAIFSIKWTHIIVDEAHAIKNIKSKRSQAVFCLQGKYRWAVTGKNVKEFYEVLQKFIDGSTKRSTEKESCNRDSHQNLERAYICPGINYKMIPITLVKSERALYDALNRLLQHATTFNRVQKLQLMCGHPHLIESAKVIQKSRNDVQSEAAETLSDRNPLFNRKNPSTKMKKTLEIIKRCVPNTKTKIIIISKYTCQLNILEEHIHNIKNKNLLTITLNGMTKSVKREVERFKESSLACILLLSMTVAAAGLDLSGASTVVFMEPHWDVDLRPEKVAYRFSDNQKTTNVYELVCVDAVDQEVQRKREEKLSQLRQN